MANVLPPHFGIQPRAVAHAPSPLGFGFGLQAAISGRHPQLTPGHHNPTAFHNLASSVSSPSARVQKRRYEQDEETETGRSPTGRDDAMERSPTPDRPRRSAPKRLRVELLDAKQPSSREEKGREEQDVDIGVLLARLPSQSLLPILMSLLNTQPSLKSEILPLIPRPTLDSAINTLAQSSKKLHDAYPYSNTPLSGHQPHPQSLGFGFGQQPSSQSSGGMRDSYILSRLRPHIAEFTAACLSYLPYFSYLPSSQAASGDVSSSGERTERMSTALQALHKDQSHPAETFLFLSAITNHIFSQPPLAQTALAEALVPRLLREWRAWVDRLDQVVNRQSGMFGSDTVQSWERWLDEAAGHRDHGAIFRPIRDSWVSRVGWLVGRTVPHRMDEL
ncbi:hypothetical protein BDN72DRAFT_784047 [Pluteus cervinus]|uniref:Uncharacterized protein n=1 Tax=Pluteus cervinus TaxID=181527 RepID=A0ACD3BH10_9AGAR|nr:hypothetical protein BDN72DRAFT_784047 [Pluteus cervinus]